MEINYYIWLIYRNLLINYLRQPFTKNTKPWTKPALNVETKL